LQHVFLPQICGPAARTITLSAAVCTGKVAPPFPKWPLSTRYWIFHRAGRQRPAACGIEQLA
jgi:hypothetical protein